MGHCPFLVCSWHEWGDMYEQKGCICMWSAGVSCIMYNMCREVTTVWRCLSHTLWLIYHRPASVSLLLVHFLTLLVLCDMDTISLRNRSVLKVIHTACACVPLSCTKRMRSTAHLSSQYCSTWLCNVIVATIKAHRQVACSSPALFCLRSFTDVVNEHVCLSPCVPAGVFVDYKSGDRKCIVNPAVFILSSAQVPT